jgi:hypothetical protein
MPSITAVREPVRLAFISEKTGTAFWAYYV